MRLNPGAAGRQGWNNASWNFTAGKPQLPKLLVNNARKGGGGARRAIESRVGRAVEGGVRKVLTPRMVRLACNRVMTPVACSRFGRSLRRGRSTATLHSSWGIVQFKSFKPFNALRRFKSSNVSRFKVRLTHRRNFHVSGILETSKYKLAPKMGDDPT